MNQYPDLQSASDIVQSGYNILEFTEAVSYKTFHESRMLQSAVFYQLIVIGEAATRLSSQFKATHSILPWRDMINMRNFLVHVFDQINPRIVWKTCGEDIPPLISYLEPLLPFPNESDEEND